MSDRRLRGLWRILALAVAVAALAGCTAANGGPAQDAAEATRDAATAAGATAAETALVVAGVVTPARAVTLRAAVGGALTEAPVTEGASVSSGTLLAQIDPTDAELDVRRAEAALAAAEARLAQAQEGARPAEIAAAAARVELADATVAQAAAQRDAVTAGLAASDALAAQAGLLEAEIAHDAADEAHEDTMTCYEVPTHDGGTREICPTRGTRSGVRRTRASSLRRRSWRW
jgi:multidrug efflux pump subunit AcrA (membrane-fusion protein)